MAIRSSMNFLGVNLENVITRVYTCKVYKEQQDKFVLDFAISRHRTLEDKAFTQSDYSCEMQIYGPNPVEQAYNHLKTLPEFADAVDC